MTAVIAPGYSRAIHPFHAVLLAGSVPLFLGAVLSDAAYASTFHIQWNNFSSWLIVGGLLFSGLALLFAIIDLLRPTRRSRAAGIYTLILFAAWVIGFLNALMHARDAWAGMPSGLVMSIIVAVLICVATWMGFRTPHPRGSR